MQDQPSASPWRCRPRLSVRAQMILVLFLGGALGWWLNQARRRQQSVVALEKLGARIARDSVLVNRAWVPRRPPWIMRQIRKAFGDGPFEEVNVVDFGPNQVQDSDLLFLEPLSELDTLSLSFTQVGDAGLRHLEGLRQLRKLYLEKTTVTDAGLAHLERLDMLETLALSGSQVSDAGLVHLKRMKRLKLLAVLSTSVTDKGIADLVRELPNVRVMRGEW
jgi:hypothetical protein